MAVDLRNSKRQDLISKKRQNAALNQILHEGTGFSETSSTSLANRMNTDMRTSHSNRHRRLTNTYKTTNE